jgi:hypothetical protein
MANKYDTPNQEERQARADDLRARLATGNIYPTDWRLEDAEAERPKILASISDVAAELDTADALAVEFVALAFQGTKAVGWRERNEARVQARLAEPIRPETPGHEWRHWRITLGYLLHRTRMLARACLRG